MTIPGPVLEDEDWSDDEFDGYVADPDDTQGDGVEAEQQDESTGESLGIGGECEIGGDGEIPQYSHHPCDNATPVDFFGMLVTDDILDNIITQTDLYASQYISTHNLPP